MGMGGRDKDKKENQIFGAKIGIQKIKRFSGAFPGALNLERKLTHKALVVY